MKDVEHYSKSIEIHDKWLEGLENPYGVYVGEAFGYCSEVSLPFDDFEFLMPHMLTG